MMDFIEKYITFFLFFYYLQLNYVNVIFLIVFAP